MKKIILLTVLNTVLFGVLNIIFQSELTGNMYATLLTTLVTISYSYCFKRINYLLYEQICLLYDVIFYLIIILFSINMILLIYMWLMYIDYSLVSMIESYVYWWDYYVVYNTSVIISTVLLILLIYIIRKEK